MPTYGTPFMPQVSIAKPPALAPVTKISGFELPTRTGGYSSGISFGTGGGRTYGGPSAAQIAAYSKIAAPAAQPPVASAAPAPVPVPAAPAPVPPVTQPIVAVAPAAPVAPPPPQEVAAVGQYEQMIAAS